VSEVRHAERQPGADARPDSDGGGIVPASHGQRVSWAELFFDLVFVFAVTQVAAAAQSASSTVAVGRALVLFVPFWWAWVGVSILYNGVELVSARRHLKVFALGLGAFVMSIAVPDAYGQRGEVFAFAYLSIRLLLAWAIWRRGFFHGPLNPYTVSAAVSAPLIVVGSFAALPARGWIWLAAAVIELASPSLLRHRLDDLRFDSSHLPERFGLFVLIALGEVLVGVGVQESRQGLSGTALTTLVLAFVFSCALWWTYFHFAAPALEHALREARIQSVLVRSVFSHGHLAMVTGLILIAAGLSQAVRTPLGHPSGVHMYFLAAGTALYVLTFCYTRARMFGGMGVARLVAGLIAAALARSTSSRPGGSPRTAAFWSSAPGAARSTPEPTPRQRQLPLTPPPEPPARYASRSCRDTTVRGLPSISTTAASAFSSTDIRALIGSPEPTCGSSPDLCSSSGSLSCARPVNSASSRSRSTIEPTISAAITGGSSLTSGIWLTPYSRRVSIAWPTVSCGCMWTRSGSFSPLRASTSATVASGDEGVRKP
jgi:low temperature requirement protein LtrA